MNLKKLALITSILITSTLIIGCTNKIEKEAMEQGKNALINSNYEEATKVFEFALKQNSENKEAEQFKNLSTLYLKANKAFKEKNYNESENLIKKMENNENCKFISDDLEALKKKIKDYKNEEKKIKKIDELIKKNNFSEAKVISEELKNKKLSKEYSEKINNLINNINNSKNTNNEENKKLTANKAMELLKKNVQLNQDQFYKFSSKDYYTLDNGSKAYVINKYYKPKQSDKEQLIAQYYIDILTEKITEKISGITKQIN
ncbi:hypothetical protein [Clostridium tarantellae]|uniref:Lipoprotein n=1 Tax=Clostridium tarantellae TaxID=39493 RepID=A0A6I1MQ11_9CLOT|nr:hypothetical protein [Clostridium tarantellae]MPQ44217.1 hypothetical protein [Clostridium tarantellae]